MWLNLEEEASTLTLNVLGVEKKNINTYEISFPHFFSFLEIFCSFAPPQGNVYQEWRSLERRSVRVTLAPCNTSWHTLVCCSRCSPFKNERNKKKKEERRILWHCSQITKRFHLTKNPDVSSMFR